MSVGNVDGRGYEIPKEKTREAYLEGGAAARVPGAESKGKEWSTPTGPNPGRDPKKA